LVVGELTHDERGGKKNGIAIRIHHRPALRQGPDGRCQGRKNNHRNSFSSWAQLRRPERWGTPSAQNQDLIVQLKKKQRREGNQRRPVGRGCGTTAIRIENGVVDVWKEARDKRESCEATAKKARELGGRANFTREHCLNGNAVVEDSSSTGARWEKRWIKKTVERKGYKIYLAKKKIRESQLKGGAGTRDITSNEGTNQATEGNRSRKRPRTTEENIRTLWSPRLLEEKKIQKTGNQKGPRTLRRGGTA